MQGVLPKKRENLEIINENPDQEKENANDAKKAITDILMNKPIRTNSKKMKKQIFKPNEEEK